MKKIITLLTMLLFSISVTSQNSVTSTTVETIVKTDSLVSLDSYSQYQMNLVVTKTGTLTTSSIKVYINDTPTLSGAQVIAYYYTSSNTKFIPVQRYFWCNTNGMNGFSKTTSSPHDFTPNVTVYSSTNVDLSCKKYIIITIQPNVSNSEVFYLECFKFYKL